MLNPNENQIFTDYCKNHFVSYNENAEEDASFLDFWRNFSSAINEKGSERAINTLLIPALPVKFNNPDDIFCEIYASVAGEIPVIKIADAEDFEKLVTNLIYKGKRPENLSSTVASFVFGKKHALSFFLKSPTAMYLQRRLVLMKTTGKKNPFESVWNMSAPIFTRKNISEFS